MPLHVLSMVGGLLTTCQNLNSRETLALQNVRRRVVVDSASAVERATIRILKEEACLAQVFRHNWQDARWQSVLFMVVLAGNSLKRPVQVSTSKMAQARSRWLDFVTLLCERSMGTNVT